MKTFDGRDIPMWEVQATKPLRCPYCEDTKPLISRAYTFQTVEKAIEDKGTVPWVPLCDEHRYPEFVDYLYLVSKEPIQGYEPSLLCGSIHVMPVIQGIHWGTECPHNRFQYLAEQMGIGIGDRLVLPDSCGDLCAATRDDDCRDATTPDTEWHVGGEAEFYQVAPNSNDKAGDSCHGCRGSAVYLGDPKNHFYEVHMPDWVWDRLIKGTILEKKPTENLFEADIHCKDDDGPTVFFNLTDGGRKFRLHEVGNGLINYLLRWKPVPAFDQAGNALEPWVYDKEKDGKFPSTTVGMAYMTPERTACAVMSFSIDDMDLTDEQKVKLAEASAKFEREAEKAAKEAPAALP